MADELVDAVTATPAGPVTIGLGQSVDVTAEYTLNGPSTALPGTSIYTILWSESSSGVWASETTPTTQPDTPFTKTCPASVFPAVGEYTLRVNVLHSGSGLSVYSTLAPDITVHVARAREIEAELPDRTLTAGLPDRTVEAELPSRTVEAGLPSRTIEGELPNRTIEAGLG